jgi:glucose repression regulatory protein TUP1
MIEGTSNIFTINDNDGATNDSGVTSVAISPNGFYVAAGSLDSVVRIWNTRSGQLVEKLRGHRDSVYSVAFTPNGKGLVSGSLDKTLKYWDLGALYRWQKDSEKRRKEGNPPISKSEESQCTMNFVGHKVRQPVHGVLFYS